MPSFLCSLMNGQDQTPDNKNADQSAPAQEPSSPMPARQPNPKERPTVPDYDLLRRIGRGSYGEVWLARSQATGALRAAKIVWRHTFEDARPFQREFAGIQSFERISREHPSQLALFHIGRNEPAGYFYYVMELADTASVGQASSLSVGTGNFSDETGRMPVPLYTPHTLRADLEKGRLSAAKVMEIGLALSEALSHLHLNGLVHRDVKPSNVIFVNGRPKLADIGLVTDASDQCSIVGTEGYLPPEGPGTPQADIFALGKVLYEAATGLDRREFPNFPPDIRSWPDAAQVFELNEIILRACAQDSKVRYQTCEGMHAELTLLGQGKSVKQKRTCQQWWASMRKASVVVIVVAILVAGATFLRWQSNAVKPLKLASAQYHTINSMTKFNEWKFDEAMNEARLAIKIDPAFLRAHGYYGWYLELVLGDVEAAMREYKIAEQIDTNDVIIQMVMADPYVMKHQYKLAIKQLNKAKQLDPKSAEIHKRLSDVYEADKQYDRAIDEHETWTLMNGNDPPDFTKAWHQKMRSILHEQGPRGWWQAQLDGQKEFLNNESYWVAGINARLGNTNEVFSFLNQAYNQHDHEMISLLEDDHWDGYRHDPRFKELLNKMGIHPIPGVIR